MKKVYFVIFFLLSCTYICVAQPPKGKQQVEAIKVAYITGQLNLTPEEAQRFWPLFNAFSNEVKQARKTYPNDEIAFDQALVDIRKKYKSEFKRILVSDARVNKVFVIERQFREVLRQELKKRNNSQHYRPN
jgi:hypothetical protein